MSRGHIPLKVQLAAALLQIPGRDGKRFVPHEQAKEMTADQIISLFERDHDPIPKAAPFNGPDEPWNLTWRIKDAHRFKTNVDNGTGRSDRQVIARTRRILKKRAGGNKRNSKIAKPANYKWPKQKLRGRGFQKRAKPEQRAETA